MHSVVSAARPRTRLVFCGLASVPLFSFYMRVGVRRVITHLPYPYTAVKPIPAQGVVLPFRCSSPYMLSSRGPPSSCMVHVVPTQKQHLHTATSPRPTVAGERHTVVETECVYPSGTTVVNDAESARRVLAILMRTNVRTRYHACDTETKNIDAKKQSPVGNGWVICASIYCGEDVDFGNGPMIWIDNLGTAEGTLDYFKEYFEDETIRKVWHNYSFDRHVLFNHGINVKGFGGDTMQMARLWNSSRTFDGGYSLEALTKELLQEGKGKVSMSTRFSKVKIRVDGTEGKTSVLADPEDLQLDPATRAEWVEYSVLDTKLTYLLREHLQHELELMPWTKKLTMWEFYQKWWLPFGELLTDLERQGIYVRRDDYLPIIQKQAEQDKKKVTEKFMKWAERMQPAAKYMNPGSDVQKQQFFFGPKGERDEFKSGLLPTRVFETDNVFGLVLPGEEKPKKKFSFELQGLGMPFVDRTPKGKPAATMEVLKKLCGPIQLDSNGNLVDELNLGGNNNLAPNLPPFGTAYTFFGGGYEGREACEAIAALVKVSAIDIMISTFIKPLQELCDEKSRIHCSLGLNTETGRLSSRRPNLQNQPALDKDVYKVREAFAAAPGNLLIVCDYGQLELRLLAHIAKCKSMIEAFALGGDFHSRTAIGMYGFIRDAVEAKTVLLEWNKKDGPAPAPLLKDVYAAERRKAKMLNFSIAYGKTARGLSKDWNTTLEEAEETLEAWYADRPEVREWQRQAIADAHRLGVTRTLMGRYRQLPLIKTGTRFQKGHMERAAINTPIQGGAADVVMAGMLRIHQNTRLKKLGWRMLLQIHDEIIAEGPRESADEAMHIIRSCMSNPFPKPLLVELVVDSKIASTWYEGK